MNDSCNAYSPREAPYSHNYAVFVYNDNKMTA